MLDWLGQAGFLLRTGPRCILIDPYLSDTLADKYRGTATPHDRLMPPPVAVEELGSVDLVLITHGHTDHMDPGTLRPLAARHPDLRFVVPRSTREEALRRTGAAEERLILVDAGDVVEPYPGLRITALRAAHESLERDADGNHRCLGYAVTAAISNSVVTLVHSGDTVPFAGQVAEFAALRPDVLLLPVNGRSPELAARNIPGNLTLDEAIALTVAAGSPALVAHHHGMFAFNTLPLETIEAAAAQPGLAVSLYPARVGLELRLRRA